MFRVGNEENLEIKTERTENHNWNSPISSDSGNISTRDSTRYFTLRARSPTQQYTRANTTSEPIDSLLPPERVEKTRANNAMSAGIKLISNASRRVTRSPCLPRPGAITKHRGSAKKIILLVLGAPDARAHKRRMLLDAARQEAREKRTEGASMHLCATTKFAPMLVFRVSRDA